MQCFNFRTQSSIQYSISCQLHSKLSHNGNSNLLHSQFHVFHFFVRLLSLYSIKKWETTYTPQLQGSQVFFRNSFRREYFSWNSGKFHRIQLIFCGTPNILNKAKFISLTPDPKKLLLFLLFFSVQKLKNLQLYIRKIDFYGFSGLKTQYGTHLVQSDLLSHLFRFFKIKGFFFQVYCRLQFTIFK